MDLDSFKKKCLSYDYIIELIESYSDDDERVEFSRVFFDCLDSIAKENIKIIEDLFLKQSLTEDESLLLAKLVLDLKTSSKIVKLKFKKQIKKIVHDYGWELKLTEFLKNQNHDWHLDSETQKIHFTDQHNQKNIIDNILWTSILEKIDSKEKPFFYLFALTTAEDIDVITLKSSFIYYLSKNLIKA